MPSPQVIVAYGSQTGCAKDISETLFAKGAHLSPTLIPLNDHKTVNWQQPTILLIVVSTTGNGEPPENAEMGWRWMRRRSHSPDLFQNVYFAVLALGDTNYTKFCNAGKNFHRRLKELGAIPMRTLACADDATGLEDTVEPWLASVYSVVAPVVDAIKGGRVWNPLPEVLAESAVGDEPPPSAPASSKPAGTGAGEAVTVPVPTPAPVPAPTLVPAPTPPTAAAPVTADDDLCPEPATTPTLYGPEDGLSCGVLPFSTLFPGELPALPKRLPKPPPCLLAAEVTGAPASGAGVSLRRASSPFIAAEHGHMAPHFSRVLGASYLTAGGRSASRRVLKLELDIEGMDYEYVPGDAIGIACPNEADAVDKLIPRLGYSADDCVCITGDSTHFPPTAKLADVFLHFVDIRATPKKTFLRLLADHSTGSDQATLLLLSSVAGRQHFAAFVEGQRLTLLDLLVLFPSCLPPLGALLSALPRLQPRYYSIASSPLVHPSSVVVALTIVEYEAVATTEAATATVVRHGLCTKWLERRCEGLLDPSISADTTIVLPVFRRPSSDFHMPGNLERPLILIGPGTGVAPFVGFLQHRRRRAELARQQPLCVCSGSWRHSVEVTVSDDAANPVVVGNTTLFFGNRRRDTDFLFEEELTGFVDDGTLTALHTAFSREQAHKVYVQHRMREHAAELAAAILEHNAFVYVCGDGANMAKDVGVALGEALQAGGLSAEEAKATLLSMRKQHRYMEDIWT